MDRHGASRRQIARTLNAAYADGLISEATFVRRLDQVLKGRLIEPRWLIGDLHLRTTGDRRGNRLANAVSTIAGAVSGREIEPSTLLALDWSGAQEVLIVGRHLECDVVLSGLSVSRRHARIFFRDGSWVLQDLGSTNGTMVNGVRVGRCELRAGDRVLVGDEQLIID